MNFYAKLQSRAILAIKGKQSDAFLQGVCTQEIEKLANNQLSYGAHLTPQGRFLYDFFILKQNDTILLECAKHELMNLAKSLHKYAVNFELDFEDATEDYDIYANWGEHLTKGLNDPRNPSLGNRIYLAKGQKPTSTEKIEQEYEQHRISLCIPDGSKDAIKERTFTAELGLEFLNGVNFEKGCYVGQELVARLHFRTEVKQRLYQIKITKPTAIGTSIFADEQEAGKVFSSYADTALAIIKTRYINKNLICDEQQIVPIPPSWWQ